MCLGCWESFGSSKIMNEKVAAAMLLIRRVYHFNCAGGGLHVQLDDWNIEDAHFSPEARECTIAFQEHQKFEDAAKQAELECFDAMAKMTLEERNSALYFEFYAKDEC